MLDRFCGAALLEPQSEARLRLPAALEVFRREAREVAHLVRGIGLALGVRIRVRVWVGAHLVEHNLEGEVVPAARAVGCVGHGDHAGFHRRGGLGRVRVGARVRVRVNSFKKPFKVQAPTPYVELALSLTLSLARTLALTLSLAGACASKDFSKELALALTLALTLALLSLSFERLLEGSSSSPNPRPNPSPIKPELRTTSRRI